MFGVEPLILAAVTVLALVAGFVKGAVGFAMPMILISGMATLLPPELALAGLIVPTLLTNLWQALRDGLAAAWESAWRFRVYLGIVLLFIAIAAQLVRVVPDWVVYLMLGLPVLLFCLAQLAGFRLKVAPGHRLRAELLIGGFAGFVGGFSGVWGPPTVVYLTALETPKADQMRIQGVIYGAGAVVLTLAHVRSGVLNAQTLPLSLYMVAPSLIGMAVGLAYGDRLDQARFRRMTLIVLAVAGANLVRRGLL